MRGAALISIAIALAVAGAAHELVDRYDHHKVMKSGGCENPSPNIGCDPWLEEVEVGPSSTNLAVGMVGGGAVAFTLAFWIASRVVRAREAKRREAERVPQARVVG